MTVDRKLFIGLVDFSVGLNERLEHDDSVPKYAVLMEFDRPDSMKAWAQELFDTTE